MKLRQIILEKSVIKNLFLFFLVSIFSGYVEFYIIKNMPDLISNISGKIGKNEIIYIIFSIFLLPLRLINLKLITHTGFIIAKVPDSIILNSLEQVSGNKISKLDPDNVRLNLSTNSYDLLRFLIIPLLSASYSLISSIFLYAGVLYINKAISLVIIIILVIFYFCSFSIISTRYKNISKNLDSSVKELNKNVREYAENLKEVYLYKLSRLLNKGIVNTRKKLYKSYVNSIFSARLTRNLLDCFIIILIALSLLIININYEGSENLFKSLISLFIPIGYSFQRLIILTQQTFNSYINIFNYKHYYFALKKFNLNLLNNKNDKKLPKSIRFNTKKSKIYDLTIKLINLKSKYITSSKKTGLNKVLKFPNLYLIKGVSGAGKSSLLETMIGFKNTETGSVEYDLKAEKIIEFRDSIAYASQYPILIEGSVEETITLARKNDIDQKLLFETALKSGCFPKNILDSGLDPNNLSKDNENLINSFLHKKVGRNGEFLSGGERKRVSIARAIYSMRPILIFDEPTSGLDDKFEKYLVKSFISLSKTRLIIISTHSKEFKIRKINNIYL